MQRNLLVVRNRDRQPIQQRVAPRFEYPNRLRSNQTFAGTAMLTEEDMHMWAKTFVPIPGAVGDAFVEVDGLRDGALLKDKAMMTQHLRTRLQNLGINVPTS